jgi:hypothetical protein
MTLSRLSSAGYPGGRRWAGFAGQVAVLGLLSAVVGCGPGQGHLSGRVLFDGKPLPGGIVRFAPADGRSANVSAEIDEAGNFTPVVLPVGEVIVSVDNRKYAPPPPRGGPITLPAGLSAEARGKMSGGGPRPPTDASAERRSSRYVEIPARYYAAETSDLRLTIQSGDQQRDVLLTK